MNALARILLWGSACAGVFLAFGWPVVVSPDPANPAFRVIATATVVVLLVSLALVVALRALAARRT